MLAPSLLALASDSLRCAPGVSGAAVPKAGAGAGGGSSGGGGGGGSAAVAVPTGLRASCVSLLVKCGLLRRHEPLQLLRAGLQPFELPEPFLSEAQVRPLWGR
eukprot:100100-Chlamydomonas_euryale.AAC.1